MEPDDRRQLQDWLWLLYVTDMDELEEKLKKFLQFAAEKNLKTKTKKFVIGSQVEFGWSVLTFA